ncbi:hypothetical protein RYX56_06350 [Alkalihalophilus lindianensis]|uniref:Uncharacterized protein n=1 Tax=Alkalihalophilus lindianensis TaxID=1630542 RepID=A0ABU3X7X2_9BACI|nr:hypothetical protein [Alkalihalophilus lindianensis]MDV2683992.1 hypothetical protein [Alkalihalophilus lindianensis]
MGSVLKASIKKIEIVNKTRKDEWDQSVRIILGDIELNNENLISLRRFRPDEIVHVSIDSALMSLFNLDKKKSAVEIFGENVKKVTEQDESVEGEEEDDDEFMYEGDYRPLGEGEMVVQEFRM